MFISIYQNFNIFYQVNSFIFIGAFAELIPHLALFISLIGAFSGSIMALIIPPFIHALVNFFYFTIMSIH